VLRDDSRAGDLQLINSHVTYHGRTPFEDDAASGHDRLLLRCGCRCRTPPLPEATRCCGASIDAGQVRGGIAQVAL
jgi:hypothetical protein